jgi:pimeloyl-ACP methyl ester carboxylesterase
MMTLRRIPLSTGVTLDVAITGDPANPPVILLHGFPESHRTWRAIAPDLARDHYVVAPDQRGFARSSKPEGVDSYTPDKIVADLIALAYHLNIDRFTLSATTGAARSPGWPHCATPSA